MPLIGTLTSGSLGAFGLVQQAQIAILKATTAISGASFDVQQTVSGPPIDPESGTPSGFIAGRNSSIPGQSSFAAHGDYLVTGAGDYQDVYVWNLSDGSLHMIVPAPSPPPATNGWGWQIDIHGDYFIAGNGSGYATVHDVSTGALITTITGAARNVAINENYAVGSGLGGFQPGSGAGKIKIFELATSTLTVLSDPNYNSSDNFGGGVWNYDISGNNLITSSTGPNGQLVTVHDIPTALSNGNLNTASLTINPTSVVSYFESLIVDGNYLALGMTSAADGSILVYDLTTGTLLHTLTAPIGAVATFGDTMNIKGNYLVAGNRKYDGGPAAVYDLTTGTLLQTFTEGDTTDISTWLNPDIGSGFGSAVAITDSKTIIGSYTGSEDSTTHNVGSFIIYSNPGQVAAVATYDFSNTTLAHTLDNPNASTGQDDQFGRRLAISGDYAIAGAFEGEGDADGTYPGKAYIYNVSTGALVHTINNPNPIGSSEFDFFGNSVAISGDRAIIGAVGEGEEHDYSGKAYIYNVTSGALVHTLDNPTPFGTSISDNFGTSVAISGDRAIVGAYGEGDAGGSYSGKAYIYDVSTGALVHTINNPNAYGSSDSDQFGSAVAISGDRAIVGAYSEGDASGNYSGKAYIIDVTTGALVHTINNPNAYGSSDSDQFGSAVAISGDHAIVGASAEDDALVDNDGNMAGKAYIYNVSTGALVHTLDNPNAYGTSDGDRFGSEVAISGDHAIVSAMIEDDADGITSGKVYIYNVTTGALVKTLDNPNAYGTSANDNFGFTVAISGDHAIVGAYGEDDAGGNTSGKAYIFSAT